jgi:hypothetical protein
MKPNPAQEHLNKRFEYRDGRLFWKSRERDEFATQRAWSTWNARFAGTEAGCISVNKRKPDHLRWQIYRDGHNYRRHRLVYAMHTNEWPLEIDHEDRDSLNDRIGNLRPATRMQNVANQGVFVGSASGKKGATRTRGGRWRSEIKLSGRRKSLGAFDTPDEAAEVYDLAHVMIYGEFSHAAKLAA